MKKRTRITISVMLSLVMLLGCIPLSIFSASAEEIEPETLPDETKITEITEYRGENEKHFSLPDGTIEAIAYPQAVHRLDSEGEWKDIDNDLSLRTVGNKQLYTTEDSRVSFASGYTRNQPLVTLNENGYSISMALLDNQNDHISTETLSFTHIDNAQQTRPESFDTLEEATRIDNRVSISYSDVMNYTNIEYILSGNDIKENIVVKARRDSYEYGFLLALDGLDAELGENGEILLRDETDEEVRYIIPAPYMYDSNNEYSNEVSYELYHVGGDKYLLTVTADEKWINQDGREFPVRIDPSVQSAGRPADTYIRSDYPNNNYGWSSQVWVNDKRVGLIKASLPNIFTSSAVGSTFNSASLYINYYGNRTSSANVGAYEILGYWAENSVTYNGMPNISSALLSSKQLSVQGTTNKIADFDVTNAVIDYYTHGITFEGIALMYIPGNGSADIIVESYESDPAKAAYITVNYNHLDITDGEYLIRSATGDFVQPTNYTSSGSNLTVSALASDAGNYQKWQLTYIGNGCYKIVSKLSGLAATVNSYGDVCAVKQQTYSGLEGQKWKIMKVTNGDYIIRPKSAELYGIDWCWSIGNNSLGAYTVSQAEFTASVSALYEWTLAKIGYMSETATWEAQQNTNWCWAATSRMFAKHYYNNISLSQSDAVSSVKGVTPPPNETGTLSETREAINLYISSSSNAAIDTVVHDRYVYSEGNLINFLNSGQVVCVSIGRYVRQNQSTYSYEAGHLMLIYGYCTINSVTYFLVRDPAEGTYLRAYSDMYYEQLSDGALLVMDGFIAPYTSYSSSTEIYFLGNVTIINN